MVEALALAAKIVAKDRKPRKRFGYTFHFSAVCDRKVAFKCILCEFASYIFIHVFVFFRDYAITQSRNLDSVLCIFYEE